jgi:ABC-type transport system involved in multi-copper enzyme maturation permease subunit
LITQTLALFLDAYRELNSKKLFWITLLLSGLCIGAFALVGVSDRGLTLLSLEFEVPMPRFFYNWVFSFFIIGIWLSWGAVLLALVSTGGMFPDLIAGGAVDLYLSKPISRLRLFLTKYVTGLVFVLLQSAVFAAVAYLVLGLRGRHWMPSLWLLVPLVVCLFSYLFSICVLLGVVTRSAIAAILVTVLIWLFLFLAAKAENGLLTARLIAEHETRAHEARVEAIGQQIKDVRAEGSITNSFGVHTALLRQRQDKARAAAERSGSTASKLRTAHKIAFAVVSALPKPGPTIDLFDRRLFSDELMSEIHEQQGDPPPVFGAGDNQDVEEREAQRQAFREAGQDIQQRVRHRSAAWVIGTSLAFEAVVLALAAWVFCRRDY